VKWLGKTTDLSCGTLHATTLIVQAYNIVALPASFTKALISSLHLKKKITEGAVQGACENARLQLSVISFW
jgi:hypothetical protein